MPRLTLTYFDAPGRAESVRIALHLAGLEFEDRRLSFEQFGRMKAEGAFPLGSVPVLQVDDLVLTQTAAMLRYVARAGAASLWPADPLAGFIVDSALDTFNDTLTNAMLPSLYERDPNKKLAMRAELAQGVLPRACGYVEGLYARSSGPFLLGAPLSIADLAIALQVIQIQRGGLDGIDPGTLEPFPRLRRLAEAFLAHKGVARYYAQLR